MQKNIRITSSIIILFLISPLLIHSKFKNQLYKKAEKLFFEKKFNRTAILLKRILNNNPNHPKALSLMGDIYLFQKAYHKAIYKYKHALKTSSNKSIEHFRIGQCYLELKQFDNAKDYFQQSYILNTKMKTALFQIGYITLFYERNKLKTIQYWEQFTEEAPNDPQYEKIKRAIELLKDSNFKIPPLGSNISIEEALLFGQNSLKAKLIKTKNKKAGDAKSKINNKIKEILEDEEL